MNALDETRLREQLDSALTDVDPAPPPFSAILARAHRRKRTWRFTGGIAAVAATGVAVAIVASVVTAGSTNDTTVGIAAAPSHQSLVAYAKTRGGNHVEGPLQSATGSYGAFATKHAIVVAHYTGTEWRQDLRAVTKLGPGRFVVKLGEGPSLGAATSYPSFAVQTVGGDVSYFGSVLRRDENGWAPARFDGCGHHGLCYAPSTSEPYGHVTGTDFVSVNNDCTPNCAAGTDFHIHWTWNPKLTEFTARSQAAGNR